MIMYGHWYHWVIAACVYFVTGCIGMTVTYHRLLSHKSFVPGAWFEKFGTLCATLGGTGSSVAWVAVHREHHRYNDTDRDPHTPKHGFFKTQFLSMLHRPSVKYVPDLLRSKFHTTVHRFYWGIHAVYAATLWLCFGPFAIVYAYLFPSFILWHAGSFVNTLGHYNFAERKITPSNHWLLGLVMWGEGFHKNHHDDVKSAYFGRRWYNPDIGYYCIKLLSK
jgi:stearoyl-CoA desaturase (delta-9 desaturase)